MLQTKSHPQYNPANPPEDTAIDLAKEHQYQKGVYGSKRRREEPSNRAGLILNAFIDLSIGNISVSDHPPSILTVGHTEVAEVIEKSVATVFNYMNTKEIFIASVVEWAKGNVNNKKCIDSKQAARKIITQFAAVFPEAAEKRGFGLKLSVAR